VIGLSVEVFKHRIRRVLTKRNSFRKFTIMGTIAGPIWTSAINLINGVIPGVGISQNVKSILRQEKSEWFEPKIPSFAQAKKNESTTLDESQGFGGDGCLVLLQLDLQSAGRCQALATLLSHCFDVPGRNSKSSTKMSKEARIFGAILSSEIRTLFEYEYRHLPNSCRRLNMVRLVQEDIQHGYDSSSLSRLTSVLDSIIEERVNSSRRLGSISKLLTKMYSLYFQAEFVTLAATHIIDDDLNWAETISTMFRQVFKLMLDERNLAGQRELISAIFGLLVRWLHSIQSRIYLSTDKVTQVTLQAGYTVGRMVEASIGRIYSHWNFRFDGNPSNRNEHANRLALFATMLNDTCRITSENASSFALFRELPPIWDLEITSLRRCLEEMNFDTLDTRATVYL
jgi:hypothetical protein